jgi:hypothetical protein
MFGERRATVEDWQAGHSRDICRQQAEVKKGTLWQREAGIK